MTAIALRTVPGLFVGRRTLVCAEEAPREPHATSYRCGACENVVITAADRSDLGDLVVKCACGAFNQL